LHNFIGDAENLKRHLENFQDINKRDLIGGSGRTVLQEATVYNQEKCVRTVLETARDVDVNQPCFLGKDTALHFAVKNCNKEITFILLRNRANPNQQNKFGQSPFDLCTDKDITSLMARFG
jgi:ankyrin repeat protein